MKDFTSLLKEKTRGDYGPDHCNRYAYDVLIANGWVAPKRPPGMNTGEGGSVAVNSLPNHPEYFTKLISGQSAKNKKNLKPGMLIRLEPQHWAVLTEHMTLNENMNGHVQNNRSIDSVLHRIKWAMMPRFREEKQDPPIVTDWISLLSQE